MLAGEGARVKQHTRPPPLARIALREPFRVVIRQVLPNPNTAGKIRSHRADGGATARQPRSRSQRRRGRSGWEGRETEFGRGGEVGAREY